MIGDAATTLPPPENLRRFRAIGADLSGKSLLEPTGCGNPLSVAQSHRVGAAAKSGHGRVPRSLGLPLALPGDATSIGAAASKCGARLQSGE